MKIISKPRNEIAATPNDMRCVAIMQRYGTALDFTRRWSPTMLMAIADNVDKSVAQEVPSLVMMIKTYGKENIINNLKLFLVYMAGQMGATNTNPEDLNTIAEMIVAATPLRTLNYAFVVTFFAKVLQGEFDVYSCKPHQFMKAMNDYAKAAHEKQQRLQREKERSEEAERYRQHQAEAVTYRQYAEAVGIDPNENPLTKFV